MDLRIVKTRKNIREAFLKLRAKNPLEKIKVKQLCDMALINKTTFYKHYQDIYALSDEIENDTIQSLMGNFKDINSLFTDPDEFIKGLYYTFKSHEDQVLLLFSGRLNVLIDKAEKQLMVHYPALGGKPEKEIMLSFLLRGAAYVLMESRYDEAVMLGTLTRIAKGTIAIFDEKTPSIR